MTDYEATVATGVTMYELKGEFFDTIIIPMCKTQGGRAEIQMVYEFDKEGKLLSITSREVA